MARLRNNVAANYAGQAWIALMGLAFVPVYLRELGAEGFGLVGFMLGLQSVSLLLDLGIGIFLNREISRRSHDVDERATTRRLVRSFEWLVWPIAAIIVATVWLCAEAIGTLWLNPERLGPQETTAAVQAIGVSVALLWPSSFYANVLTGLEQQPRLNLLAAIFATLRYGGALPLIFFTEWGVVGFILWHALIGLLQTASYALSSWRLLPPSVERPRFHPEELRNARRFALGVFATTALALLLTQADRFILAAMQPLEELGYYTVALTLVAGAGRLMQPMFGAIYPRMSRLVATGDRATLIELYHVATQCLAVVAAVVACVAWAYAGDLVYLWTGDASLGATIGVPLAILAAGTAINGLMTAPYALQLAHGMTRLTVVSNAVALVIGVPLCIVAVRKYGMTGAALLWLGANLGYLALTTPVAHRRLLPQLGFGWYVRDLAPAMLGAGAVVWIASWVRPSLQRDVDGVAWLLGVSLVAGLAAASVSPRVRSMALRHMRPET